MPAFLMSWGVGAFLKPVSNGMNKIRLQARLFSRNSYEYGFLANGGESNGLAESSLG